MIKAGREFKLPATISLGETAGVSLALPAGNILIRGESHLYCIAAPEDAADAAEGERGGDDLATVRSGAATCQGVNPGPRITCRK